MKRIRNFLARWYRYFIAYQLIEGGIKTAWRMASTTEPSGYSHRLNGQKRDAFDHVADFLADQFSTLKMFWREEMCSHPSSEIYRYDEGDEEWGPIIQTTCDRCGGYISDNMIDRY
jgi:hypothetical protein